MSQLEPTVLVAGHDPERPAIREALETGEFDPRVVAEPDVPSALAAIDRRRVDCVVSAYELPDETGRTFMGGLSLLESVRDEHEDLPFVLLSAVVTEDSLRLAADLGVRAYVRDRAGENVVEQLRYNVDSALRGRLAERRAAEQDRINELMRGVTQTLVLEEDRDSMLRALCGELTGAEVYRYAAYFPCEESALTAEPTVTAGAARADTEPRPLLAESFEARSLGAERLAAEAASHGADGAMRVAVPIGYEAERYGVLLLETSAGHGFFDTERAVLSELGEAIGHALNAIDTRDALREREADLRRRTEQLEKFASLVSHDIRNPLNVAQGYVDLLSERTDDEAVGEIATSLDRIETIVQDILTLSKAGTDMQLAPTDLGAVVEQAWASVETADDTGEPIACLEADDLPRVRADASQLQRVFENLFRNAIEHGRSDQGETADDGPDTGDGPLVITVEYADGDLLVTDDGVGFPGGASDDLFEFGETRSTDGTGLGLAIVADLVAEHGWSIAAEDAESGGARFRIEGIDPLESW